MEGCEHRFALGEYCGVCEKEKNKRSPVERGVMPADGRKDVEMTYGERKAKRKEHYEKEVKGWKERPCSACNGVGVYDNFGTPQCSACNGTGRERYKPEKQA